MTKEQAAVLAKVERRISSVVLDLKNYKDWMHPPPIRTMEELEAYDGVADMARRHAADQNVLRALRELELAQGELLHLEKMTG